MLCVLLSILAGTQSAASCPVGMTAMGSTDDGWAVCERLGVDAGVVRFVKPATEAIELRKTAEPLHVDESGCYLGMNKSLALGSHADLLGNTLLARAAADGGRDPTLAEITGVVPPLQVDGRTHSFVGSRGSSVDVVFDALGADVNNMVREAPPLHCQALAAALCAKDM